MKTFIKILKSAFRLAEAAVSVYVWYYYLIDDDNPESILEFIVDGIDSNPNVGEGHLNSTQRMDVQEFTRVFNNYNKRYRR